MKVRDIENRDDLILVQDSQDIESIEERTGAHGYCCYFVKIEDGDYTEVYGCETHIPYLESYIDSIPIP